MLWTERASSGVLLVLLFASTVAAKASSLSGEPSLPRQKLAAENFGADASWFFRDIPFLAFCLPTAISHSGGLEGHS
jgi:hypothetical protein